MPSESWTLDSLSLSSGAFDLIELTADPPAQRPNWITAADSESAALFRQPLHENRTITMKLKVRQQPSMDTALDRVGALVDKLRKASASTSGIGLVWTPNDSARSVTFTVLAGEISGMPIGLSDEGYLWVLRQPVVAVSLTCQPYWIGTETLTSTNSSSTPLNAFEITGVTGDIPALGRLIITDTATQSRRHVEWGIEGPLTYNSSTSLIVDSDNMVVTGFSGVQAVTTGAYDPNAAGNNSITLSPIAGATTAMAGTGDPLSHVGVFRVKARVQSSSLGNLFRLSWKAGDGPTNHNTWATPISVSGWIELDLGTITVPAVTLGTQRWTGQVEVQGDATTPGTVALDYLILVPQADGYGKARAVYGYSTGVLAGYDQFTATTAGVALNARTAPLGGAWATAGSATDLAFADDFSGEQVKRSASGTRWAALGTTNFTDTEVSVSVTADTFLTAPTTGALARYVDTSNYVYGALSYGIGGVSFLVVAVVVAGVTVAQPQIQIATPASGTFVTLRMIVYASGRVILSAYSGSNLLAQMEMQHSALATGGALASGKPGIYDSGTSPANRWYDNFYVSTPAAEPVVLYSGKNMQVRYDDTLRQDSTGAFYGRPPSYKGSRFLVPVGTSRVLVKARRNDIEAALDDQVTDALQIQISWTPRGLAVPR